MASQSQTSLSLEIRAEQVQEAKAIASYPLYFFLDIPWTSPTTSQLVFAHTEPPLVPVSLVLAEHRAVITERKAGWGSGFPVRRPSLPQTAHNGGHC